jgi:hypothetical protein
LANMNTVPIAPPISTLAHTGIASKQVFLGGVLPPLVSFRIALRRDLPRNVTRALVFLCVGLVSGRGGGPDRTAGIGGCDGPTRPGAPRGYYRRTWGSGSRLFESGRSDHASPE